MRGDTCCDATLLFILNSSGVAQGCCAWSAPGQGMAELLVAVSVPGRGHGKDAVAALKDGKNSKRFPFVFACLFFWGGILGSPGGAGAARRRPGGAAGSRPGRAGPVDPGLRVPSRPWRGPPGVVKQLGTLNLKP